MKINSFLKVMMAAVAVVIGVCACSSDDDEPEVAVASQVAGTYTGTNVILIMGEGDEETVTYEFTKSSETTIDMTIPQSGDGMMAIPPLTVKNIPLTKIGKSITGSLSSYAGTVLNSAGAEKAFTVSNLMVMFEDVPKGKAVVATFTLKYGSMPFDMVTTFNGDKN